MSGERKQKKKEKKEQRRNKYPSISNVATRPHLFRVSYLSLSFPHSHTLFSSFFLFLPRPRKKRISFAGCKAMTRTICSRPSTRPVSIFEQTHGDIFFSPPPSPPPHLSYIFFLLPFFSTIQ